jgi:hypothetical protein
VKIVILGWGSLLWEDHPQFDRHHGDWRFDGPILPIEFSRVSQSRCGALTLVIDPEQGTPTRVAWCRSARRTLSKAVEDLQVREQTSAENIGQLVSGADVSGLTEVARTVREWAEGHKTQAVLWTALTSNFHHETGTPFSVPAAVAHVAGLDRYGKQKAADYVWRAPDFVVTPTRAALQGILKR